MDKKKLFFCATAMMLSSALLGKKVEKNFFLNANKLYKQSRYNEAKKEYEKVPNKGSIVHYNLGNCFYKMGKLGHALAHWRRAERMWDLPNRLELLDNISLLKTKISGEKRGRKIFKKLLWFKAILISYIISIPLIFLQFLFLLVWFFLFIYLKFLSRRKERLIIFTLFSFIALFGIVLAVRYNVESNQHGVVIQDKAPLLSGPHHTCQEFLKLREAEEVLIKEEKEEFFKVKSPRATGWVAKQDIERYDHEK